MKILLIFDPPSEAGDLDVDLDDEGFGMRLRAGGDDHTHDTTTTETKPADTTQPINQQAPDTVEPIEIQTEDPEITIDTEIAPEEDNGVPEAPPTGARVILKPMNAV